MKTYAAFLRAVNLGRKNVVPMPDLKELLLKSGYDKVVTLLNSGNVVFQSDSRTASVVGKNISGLVEKKFKIKIAVIALETARLERILEACPFDYDELSDGGSIYVTLLNGIPADAGVRALKSVRDKTDECVFSDQVVYILAKKGYSNTVFGNNFIEKTLKVEATTRNTNTLKRIVDIGKGMA